VPVTVAINHFASDTAAEHAFLLGWCRKEAGVEAHLCGHWAEGGEGATALAAHVVELAEGGAADFHPLYPDGLALPEKIRTIATTLYGAADVAIAPAAQRKLEAYAEAGFGQLPVCMAKTQSSFSADPTLLGAPSGHVVPVRDVRLSAGAGFVVAICGDVMTMPGLPREPAAHRIRLDARGEVEGLF
jgi:formate--tetrahydrofolate ligase